MAKKSSKSAPKPRRVAIVGGPAPFVRAFAEYTQMDTIALGSKPSAASWTAPRSRGMPSTAWCGRRHPASNGPERGS